VDVLHESRCFTEMRKVFPISRSARMEACVRSGAKSNLPSSMILGDPTGSAQRIGEQQAPMQNTGTDEDEA
jgi:hypothetical protein